MRWLICAASTERPKQAHGKFSAAMADPFLKQVRALHQRKQREATGRFLVQGRKVVAELLASGLAIDSIHATEEVAESLSLRNAHITAAHDLARMGTLEHGNELIAVVRTPVHEARVRLDPKELVIALDGIADPGNLGTVLRIADWFGVRQVWCSADCVEAYNPKCVQASMGSLFRISVVHDDLPRLLRSAGEQGSHIYKADANGTSAFDASLQRPAVLVMGSESHGLREQVRAIAGTTIAIPRYGKAESLNVSTAAAALCMEFARRD